MSCCCSSQEMRVVKLQFWRFTTLAWRYKFYVFMLSTALLYQIGFAIAFRYILPAIEIPESYGFDQAVSLTTAGEKQNFAQKCTEQKGYNVIGYVYPPDAPQDLQDATDGIMGIIQRKMLLNESDYFDMKKFDSADDLEDY